MKFVSTLLLICILRAKLNDASSPSGDGPWGYYHSPHGVKTPEIWKEVSATCGLHRQSPIDIQTKLVKYTEHLDPIKITREHDSTEMVYLEKHRTSVYLTFNNIWKITFGDTKCIKPVAIHWHWGSVNTQGSEHTVNGHAYPIEGHLVSYNCEKYQSIKTALVGADGLYVIGVFYKIGDRNEALDKILSAMGPLIEKKATNVTITEIPPSEILPKHLEKYYQYDGSLTTPPCTENVRWTVLADPLTIDEAQLDKFRHLESESIDIGKMVDNYRKTLSVEDRVVISSFKGDSLALNWTKLSLGLQIVAMLMIFSYQ